MKRGITLVIGFTMAVMGIYLSSCQQKQKTNETTTPLTQKISPIVQMDYSKTERKKILYIDSYHLEFGWSYEIMSGITSSLNVQLANIKEEPNDFQSPYQFKAIHMDTKRNTSEEFKETAAKKALTLIKEWKPDIIITSDDNAAKYLVVPYLMKSEIPIVFCGLNWDASVYGFPTKHITGMVEITLLPQLLKTLSNFSKGRKIGIIGSDTLSVKKDVLNCEKKFKIDFIARYSRNFTELKKHYLELQQKADLVIVEEFESVPGFNRREMIDFIYNNTQKPTGAMYSIFSEFALITFANKGEEQGKYAAQTAIKILKGTSPEDIPIVFNQKAKIYLNMELAKIMNIKFPMDLIEQAAFVGEENSGIEF